MNRRLPYFLALVPAAYLLVACQGTAAPTGMGGPGGMNMGTGTGVDTAAPTGLANAGNLLALAAELGASNGATNLAYSVASAQKWSNFPAGIYRDRVGVKLSDLTEGQLKLAKGELQAATGAKAGEGWDELQQTLNHDDYLGTKAGGYASGNYYVAHLGTPAASGTWQLYFGGHHFALTNTYKDGKLVGATPSFRGVEPFTAFEQNGRSNQPMAEEATAMAAALQALTAEQQARAQLNQRFGDILVGPQKDGTFPATPVGVRVGDLGAEQQAKVLAAIATYVDDLPATDAATILAKYQAELPETYLSYSGTTGVDTTGDYFRVDGPSVWVELSMQNGVILNGPHPHSVWRDKKTDYGGNT